MWHAVKLLRIPGWSSQRIVRSTPLTQFAWLHARVRPSVVNVHKMQYCRNAKHSGLMHNMVYRSAWIAMNNKAKSFNHFQSQCKIQQLWVRSPWFAITVCAVWTQCAYRNLTFCLYHTIVRLFCLHTMAWLFCLNHAMRSCSMFTTLWSGCSVFKLTFHPWGWLSVFTMNNSSSPCYGATILFSKSLFIFTNGGKGGECFGGDWMEVTESWYGDGVEMF